MATITAGDIVERAEILLQDETNVRWPVAELLKWINDAQRAVAALRPDATAFNTTLKLTPGTKQTLPANAISLIEVVRNMGSNGSTPGRAIRLVNREVLDSQNPLWHESSATNEVKHYFYDKRVPRNFYVYPPQPSSTSYVELVYSVSPSEVVNEGSLLALDDVFANSILNYVVYRAYSKDAEFAENGNKAAAYYQAFAAELGLEGQSKATVDPNMVQPPYNPNV